VSTAAHAVLNDLQSAIDARDLDALTGLFDEPAVLVGTSGHAVTAQERRSYLNGVISGPAAMRWEWREVIPVHETETLIALTAFGDIVVTSPDGEDRSPIRVSVVATRVGGTWRLKQFHGSIPSDW
jgi:ketosteroid isomerase-like protein